jgi:phosphate-selective porin
LRSTTFSIGFREDRVCPSIADGDGGHVELLYFLTGEHREYEKRESARRAAPVAVG